MLTELLKVFHRSYQKSSSLKVIAWLDNCVGDGTDSKPLYAAHPAFPFSALLDGYAFCVHLSIWLRCTCVIVSHLSVNGPMQDIT